MITIHYNTTTLDIIPNDESYRYRAIMGENSLTLKFSSETFIELPIGAYVDYEGQRYTLLNPENFTKNGTRIFEYTLILESAQGDLRKYLLRDKVDKLLKFSLTAKPQEHIQLIVDNLNERDSGWTIGSFIDASEKHIVYNHNSLADALQMIADAFNTEWEVSGKTIHLKRLEYNKDFPLALSYGKGNGFRPGVGRSNSDNSSAIEVLYVQGGERNIDRSTYGSNELRLPKSQVFTYEGREYVTDALGLSVKRNDKALSTKVEQSLDLSDIYPSRVGVVSSVEEVDVDKNFYDFIDNSIPANLNYSDCLIAGEAMTVIFQSGMLAGKEFDISYNHDENRFAIVPQEIDGITMPNDVFKPTIGDGYAVFGMDMPAEYICDNATQTGASWDMLKEAVKFLYENENPRFTFSGELDGIWAKNDWLNIGGKIVLGGIVNFSDPQFFPAGELIRIIGVKDYINNPHSPELELSNVTVGGSILSKINKVDSVEVTAEENYKQALNYTKRRFRSAQETIEMLSNAIDGFGEGINPITVQSMSMLVGDNSLQFRFVNNNVDAIKVSHNITFNNDTKILSADGSWMQHMTIGITEVKAGSRDTSEYSFWNVAPFNSPALVEAGKAYYLYIKASKTTTSATFYLSETPIALEEVADFYHFLTGILNSESGGERTFAPLYGFTEVLPGQINTSKIHADTVKVDQAFAQSIYATNAEISGTLLVDGSIIADKIDVNTLMAQSLIATDLNVVYGKVGNFTINSSLVGENNGRIITLDPDDAKVLIEDEFSRSVDIRAGALSSITEISGLNSRWTNAAYTIDTFTLANYNIDEVLPSALEPYDENNISTAPVHDVYLSFPTFDVTQESTAEVFSSLAFVDKAFLPSPDKDTAYTFDVPIKLGFVHSDVTHDGKYDLRKGTLVYKITVGVYNDANELQSQESVHQDSLYIFDKTTDVLEYYKKHRLQVVVPQGGDSYYIRVKVQLGGGIQYEEYNSGGVFEGSYWSSSDGHNNPMHFSINTTPNLIISSAKGKSELTTDGYQTVWTTERYFRIDGNSTSGFIESKGDWVHNGYSIVTDGNLETSVKGIIDPANYYTTDYIDTNFALKTHTHTEYLGVKDKAADSDKLDGLHHNEIVAYHIYNRVHTTNDVEYPVTWHNNSQDLYNSGSHFTYNPANRRLRTGIIESTYNGITKVNLSTNVGGSGINIVDTSGVRQIRLWSYDSNYINSWLAIGKATNPTEALDVKGNIQGFGSDYSGIKSPSNKLLWHHQNGDISLSAGGTNGVLYLGFNQAEYTTKHITTDTFIKVNSRDTPTEALDVNGNAKANILYASTNSTNIIPSSGWGKFDGYGIIGNRSSFYVYNGQVNSDIRFGVGGVHGSNNIVYINNTGLSIKTGTVATEALDVNGNIKANGDIRTGTSGALVCRQTAGTDTTTGLSLYSSSDNATAYGIQFMRTSTYGTHGSVTGDWATYFNMSNTVGRGWIFRCNGGDNVASIAQSGDFTTKGYLQGTTSFSSGFAGQGWRLNPNDNGDSHLTVDRLTVRGGMLINELVVNKIRSTNGSLWVSDSMVYEKDGGSDATYYRIELDLKDGEQRPVPFRAGDIVKYQTFDGTNVSSGQLMVDAVVNSADRSYIRCPKSSLVGDAPSIGDTIVRVDYNGTTYPERKGALYLTSSDSGSPFLDVTQGDGTGNYSPRVRLGRLDGISNNSGYGIWGSSDGSNEAFAISSDGYARIAGWNFDNQRLYNQSSANQKVWMGVDYDNGAYYGFGIYKDGSDYIRMIEANDHYYFQARKDGTNIVNFTTNGDSYISGWNINADEISKNNLHLRSSYSALQIDRSGGGHIMVGQTYVNNAWTGKYGMSVTDSSGNAIFKVDDTGVQMAGFEATSTYLKSTNGKIQLNADGSFSFADGKILGDSDGSLSLDGGLISNQIKSFNYKDSEGVSGTYMNLNNGDIVVGGNDGIVIKGETGSIEFKSDSYGRQVTVTKNDLPNVNTIGGVNTEGSINTVLNGIITRSPYEDEHAMTDIIKYVALPIFSSTANTYSTTIGNLYSLDLHGILDVDFNNPLDIYFDRTTGGTVYAMLMIKTEVLDTSDNVIASDNTEVFATVTEFGYSMNAIQTYRSVISFVATSSSVKVKVSYSLGGYRNNVTYVTDHDNVYFSIGEGASVSLRNNYFSLKTSTQKVDISTKGLSVAANANNYFQVHNIDNSSSSNPNIKANGFFHMQGGMKVDGTINGVKTVYGSYSSDNDGNQVVTVSELTTVQGAIVSMSGRVVSKSGNTFTFDRDNGIDGTITGYYIAWGV